MVGLPGLDSQKTLKCLRLGCLFLLLLAVQSLAVSAEQEPLQVTGTGEVLLLLSCISAVAVWEAAKTACRYVMQHLCGTKRSRRINKLRELAKAAAETEIEKWVEREEPVSSESVTRSLREVLREERQGTVPSIDSASPCHAKAVSHSTA